MTQGEALKILKTGANVFLTGEPGSGKTHTINEYISYLRDRGIEPAVTASTGIAATHIGGMTIHSWSGIGVRDRLSGYDLDKIASTEYVVKRVKRANVLVIDEVSMLPPGTIAMVDAVAREIRKINEPFGGMQVVLIGDFFQLPPIIRKMSDDNRENVLFEEETPVFVFESPVFASLRPIVCYLSEQHRQDDDEFLKILSAIRSDMFREEHLALLKKRKTELKKAPKDAPKLFSHNADVDAMNDEMLSKIPTAEKVFNMASHGKEAVVMAMKKGCLSPEKLRLKIGAQVMFTRNDQEKKYVNGTLGVVESFSKTTGNPIVRTRTGRAVEAEPADWIVEERGKELARLSQIPLRLAWAITVHKSQGMSLDEAVMDLSQIFEYGQGYVALSRVRKLSGLHILGWNKRAFEVHPKILEKDEDFRRSSDEAISAFEKMDAKELEKMHDNFVISCGGTVCPSSARVKPVKGNTFEKTLALWKEGKNIEEIAKSRELTRATIFDHIEKLAGEGKIGKGELMRIVPAVLSPALPKISAVFKELDTDKLTPVYEKLGGKYSYDDLRLARMLLKFESL